MSEDKGFLSRWSDRKLSTESAELQSLSAETEQAEGSAGEFEGKSDEEILTILELPEPEALKLGDTVEKFMNGRVPERIRARALRAFWKTNPVLANIDGLDEYCDDYTDAAMIIENMQTIYQAGKGYATQALEVLESLAEDENQTDKTSPVKSIDQSISDRELLEASVNTELQLNFAETEKDDDNSQTSVQHGPAPTETLAPKPRRMIFD